MNMRQKLVRVAQSKGHGIIQAGEFTPICADDLVFALKADSVMTMPIEKCSDDRAASAVAIIVIATLHQGGTTRSLARRSASRLIQRIDELEARENEEARRAVSEFMGTYRQRLGVTLGDAFRQKLKNAS